MLVWPAEDGGSEAVSRCIELLGHSSPLLVTDGHRG